MILDLEDGREIRLPDEMPDETARQLKTLILALEERARTAESEVRLLRDEMALLRTQMTSTVGKADQSQAVVAAVAALRSALESGVKRIVDAQLADTVLVMDEYGEQTKSRKVLK